MICKLISNFSRQYRNNGLTIAQSNRCFKKKLCVASKKQIIATLIVAHVTRNPKLDASLRKPLGINLIISPILSLQFLGGICSGSFLFP